MEENRLDNLGGDLKISTRKDKSLTEERIKTFESMRSLRATEGDIRVRGGTGGNERSQIVCKLSYPFSPMLFFPSRTSGPSLLLIGITTANLLKTSMHTKPALIFGQHKDHDTP
jgi:hypothetical protein